jgi:hypothetical protein
MQQEGALVFSSEKGSKEESSKEEMRVRFMSLAFGVKYENGIAVSSPQVATSSKVLTRIKHDERIALLVKWHGMPASNDKERAARTKFKQKHRQGYRLDKVYRVTTNVDGSKKMTRLPAKNESCAIKERKVCHADDVFDIIHSFHLPTHMNSAQLAGTILNSWWNVPRNLCEVYISLCPFCSARNASGKTADV